MSRALAGKVFGQKTVVGKSADIRDGKTDEGGKITKSLATGIASCVDIQFVNELIQVNDFDIENFGYRDPTPGKGNGNVGRRTSDRGT